MVKEMIKNILKIEARKKMPSNLHNLGAPHHQDFG